MLPFLTTKTKSHSYLAVCYCPSCFIFSPLCPFPTELETFNSKRISVLFTEKDRRPQGTGGGGGGGDGQLLLDPHEPTLWTSEAGTPRPGFWPQDPPGGSSAEAPDVCRAAVTLYLSQLGLC